jgi:Ca-activated chloride channel family protein
MWWFNKGVVFEHPSAFWLFLLLLIPIPIYIWKRVSKKNVIALPAASVFSRHTSWKIKLMDLPSVLRVLSIACMILALARPQSTTSWQDVRMEGVDIVIALDISASMLARDLSPNRLEASKAVAQEFIDKRPDDRIGLVIFSGESFTQCPLTSDHTVIKNLFNGLKCGLLNDGTAIGLGLSTAVARLKDSKAKSKVVILLTDGVNNSGSVSPMMASELARPFGIRVYTIGIGTRGKAYSPVGIYPNGEYAYDYVPVEIDEKTMKSIAEQTGGKYFRATNKKSLQQTYAEIDKMEKSIIEERQYSKRTELFRPLALAALSLLILEFFLRRTIFKTVIPD